MKIPRCLFFCLMAVCICACNNTPPDDANSKPKSELPDISSVTSELPEAPGSSEFKSNCLTCHSAMYIEMQPNFPQKTWQKTVDKMIKVFGAPITDSAAARIVNYLVTIKGKK